MKTAAIILSLFISFLGFAQKKELKTQFINSGITIDGKANEKSWETANKATDFVMYEPENGKAMPQERRTEVKVLYDNDAIYVFAEMFDNEPQKIMKEISTRDDFGTSDVFGIFINGFNDGQQDFRFFATASDGQGDCLATESNGEDFSWDAVWQSKAILTKTGWAAEFKIPYAALRFSADKVQKWGINFIREIRRDRAIYSWNPVDNKVNAVIQQAGILTGIENIKTPTRLFFLPYTSSYLNANDANGTNSTQKGGLDVKYGINDAFTLDMVLIPDFGQTKFDDAILNLGPFEQQLNENRSFFTEGTDLFSKGNLFYSRRIGGSPTYELKENEEYVASPQNVSLLNALKVSGRTKDGLGVGILNAITEKTRVDIRNTVDNITTKTLVEPLSNYNILVFDQRFRKNSSVSFINTNVTRNGSFRDANVSALIWDLNTKDNKYGLSGDFKYSYVNDATLKKGISSSLRFNESEGKYRYNFGGELVTKDYNIDDMGINFETNYYNFFGGANYRILQPIKKFNSFFIGNYNTVQFQKETNKVQQLQSSITVEAQTKNNIWMGAGLEVSPIKTYDYYEPRVENRFYIRPSQAEAWLYISTNYNKKFAIDVNPFKVFIDQKNATVNGINISPRYRFNDKLLLSYDLRVNLQRNLEGYVTQEDFDNNSSTPNSIIFGERDRSTFVNGISGKYGINSRMTFNLSVRYYWSYYENKKFYTLEQDGKLKDLLSYDKNKNGNFNNWNFDLSYNYWFAPGSQISVLYRNNAAQGGQIANKKFGDNVSKILNDNLLNHVFSISVRYFIDYNQAKNWF